MTQPADPHGAHRATGDDPRPRVVVGDDVIEISTWLIAWWTLLYWIGWTLDQRLWGWGWLWLATSVIGVATWLLVRRRRAAEPSGSPVGVPGRVLPPPGGARVPLVPLLLGVAAVGVVLLVLPVARDWPAGGFRLLWALPLLAMLAGLVARLLDRRDLDRPADAAPRREHLAALGLAVAVGALSLFVKLADSDDPYYLNRSVWIAEHGTAMVRDTMFGPGTYESPYNGGIPIASVEGLIGVLSHMTGVSAGTLTWVVTTGIGATASVWAFWALSRRWAPRWPLVALVVTVAFMLLSGESRFGNFWIARMWQGKVLALTVLLPLIWVWADDLVRGAGRRRWLTMLVAGIAFVGLTSTAVILVPFVTGGIVVAALVLRHRDLLVGGLLLSVGPVLSGLAVVVLSTGIGDSGALREGAESFERVFGTQTWMVAVALIGLGLTPLLVRSRAGALMAGATVVATFVVFVPPLLRLAHDLTGSGPILWRVLFVVPIGVLVGLLAVARPPWLRGTAARAYGVVLPVVLVASFVVAGAGLWNTTDHGGPAELVDRPTWKVDLVAKDRVEAVLETGVTGVLLLPAPAMRLMPMMTTEAYAVDARNWYTRILAEPQADNDARRLLARFARNDTPNLTAADLGAALARLDVQLVCLRDNHFALEEQRLADAGWSEPERLAGLTCVRAAG